MGYQPIQPPSPYGETRLWYKYVEKFAFSPVRCLNGKWVWFHKFYERYIVFEYDEIDDKVYFRGRMTEEDVIIEKLTGTIDFH